MGSAASHRSAYSLSDPMHFIGSPRHGTIKRRPASSSLFRGARLQSQIALVHISMAIRENSFTALHPSSLADAVLAGALCCIERLIGKPDEIRLACAGRPQCR